MNERLNKGWHDANCDALKITQERNAAEQQMLEQQTRIAGAKELLLSAEAIHCVCLEKWGEGNGVTVDALKVLDYLKTLSQCNLSALAAHDREVRIKTLEEVMKLYSPDDTAHDYFDKLRDMIWRLKNQS